MDNYIKALIDINKFAVGNIKIFEDYCRTTNVSDEKAKADFGNACICLHGFRDVADATESMLINAGVFKDDNNNFFEKIDTEEHNDAPEDNEKQTEPNGK